MKEQNWSYVDKSGWLEGQWLSEPDKVQFSDVETGLPCLVVRGPSGALCGYVGVAEGHPLFGVEYSSCSRLPRCEGYCNHSPESMFEVHGGITFSDFCQVGAEEGRGICHVPSEGEPERVFWFGFDCAHSGDVSPKYDRDHVGDYSTYKDIGYVKGECYRLAAQLIQDAATASAQ